MAHISQNEVEHVAQLARLELTEPEKTLFGEQLSQILTYVGQLQSPQLKGLRGLANRGLEELCVIPGIGPAKAAQILAAVELGKRALAAPLTEGKRIQGSKHIFQHYYPLLRDMRHEVFKAVLLDAKHTIIRDFTVSQGSLTVSIVHPREVFNVAVRESAAAIIFVHNHPSGDPQPSEEDHALTQRLIAAGEILGIQVLDHIVIGDGKYVSFADEGFFTTTS